MYNENNRSMFIMLGLGITAFLGLAVFFILRTGAFAMPMIPMIFAVIILLGIVAAGVAIRQQASGDKAKRKHEMDMYAVIDRLIEDLNEDEADYLWRKLNAADRQETAESLTALLDEREQQNA